MSKLTQNYSKQGTRAKGATWEWFTQNTPAGSLHVHNRHGYWSYDISFAGTGTGFKTKEDAYEAGKAKMIELMSRSIEELND